MRVFSFLGVAALVVVGFSVAGALQAAEPLWVTTPGSQCPLIRKQFVISAKPTRAVLRIVGLGHYDLRVNGRRVGDAVMRQPWSQYDKTIYYDELDITSLLREGTNAVGVMLGNSFWFNPPAPKERYHKEGAETDFGPQYLLWVAADIDTADGKHSRLTTDATWKSAPGPLTFSHVYAGEDYDAGLERPGWDSPGFDDRDWSPVAVARTPGAKLEKQDWPPIREQQVFPARQIVRAGPNVFQAFFGQNASGIVRFTVEGTRGQSFTIQPSEYRTDEGQFKKPLWGTPVLCRYTLAGGGPETHQWLFFYHGFQAVELVDALFEGQPNPNGLPVIRRIELVHTRTDLPEVGQFRTSSPLYNDTHRLIDWALRSNMSYVMTDCPHREKLGWLDCWLLAPTYNYRYDCRDWLSKITRDIRDAQEPSGRILTVAPSYPGMRFPGPFHWTPEWGAAGVLLPWHHYVWYGDPRILRDNFDCMRRFVDFVASTSKDHIAPAGLGDWYDYGHGGPPGASHFTPAELTATAVQAMCLDAVAKAADVLGRPADATHCRKLQRKTAASFLTHFYDRKSHTFTNHGSCQCANAISLVAGLVPDEDRRPVLDAIVADVQRRGWQQTPGDIGHVFFIRALAEAGRSDVLHRVFSRDGVGSYGGILRKGLTAMPETWDAMNDGYQSQNHAMLGHVVEWYYGHVAGVRQQPGSVGWTRLLIAPEPGPLAEATASFIAPTGRIASRWSVRGATFRLDAEIPPGATARLVGPDGAHRDVGPGRHTLECAVRQSK
ncbi:MAG: family 78 glycoside hydrolase catalytic domain [Thermoguttaceae bacterium]